MAITHKSTYSICITNYNTVYSVRQSLESLFSQIDERFEIIVVDNQSNDGSLDILRHYEKMGKIKLVIKRCNRGLGWQIGIKNSKGKYIVNAGMDDVFNPYLNRLLEIYHARFEGCLLLVQGQPGMIIAPKELIDEVGGYRDLNYLEDRDLFSRVAEIGRFRFLKSFRVIAYTIHHPNRKYQLFTRLQKQYLAFRESFRIGQVPNLWRLICELRDKWSFPVLLVISIIGFITHWFYPRYRNEYVNSFNPEDHVVKIGGY